MGLHELFEKWEGSKSCVIRMEEYGEIPVRFYNFRYCTWYRWLWIILVVTFFLLLEYVILSGEPYLILVVLFLSVLSLFMAFYTWKYRLRLDMKDGILEIGRKRIRLKNCTVKTGRKFMFRRIIITCGEGDMIVLTSIMEDFDGMVNLILRAVHLGSERSGGMKDEDEESSR